MTWSWRNVPPPKGEKTDVAPITDLSGSKGEGKIVAATSPDAAPAILGNRYNKGSRYRIVPEKSPTGGYVRVTTPADPDKLDPGGYCGEDGKLYKADGTLDDTQNGEAVKVKIQRLKRYTSEHDVTFSWEATVMPPWFSNIYTPSKIGPEFYQPMYGCGSILDDPPIQIHDKSNLKEMTVNPTTGVETNDETGVAVIRVPFAVGGGDEYREVRIPKDFIDPSLTSQQAADSLADIWLGLKEIDASTDLYIDAYNDRKYANMIQVLGNSNPYIMLKLFPPPPPSTDMQRGLEQVRGFHGDAFGPFEGLKKGFPEAEKDEPLVAETLPKINSTSGVKPREVDGSIDPRKARYERVLQYINALRNQGFRNNEGEYEQTAKG